MPLGGEYRILAEPKGQAGLHNPAAQHLRDVAQFGSAPALGAGCRRFKSCRPDHICGRSSSVEPQPSKLMRRVRLPSPAPETQQARSLLRFRAFSCRGPGVEPGSGCGAAETRERFPAQPARRASAAAGGACRQACGDSQSRRSRNATSPEPPAVSGFFLLRYIAVAWWRYTFETRLQS